MAMILWNRQLVLVLIAGLLTASAAGAAEIAPTLAERLHSAGADDYVPIVVLMDEYPRGDSLLAEVRGLNRKDRRKHTVARMKTLAAETQTPVHEILEAAGDDAGRVRVLWGINGVALRARPHVIERLANVPGVRRLFLDGSGGRPAERPDAHRIRRPGAFTDATGESFAGGISATGPTGGDTSGPNPNADVAPEVISMGGKQVWDDLGYTGAGVIVAVIDSGMDRTHPDLADHIWTNLDEIPDNGTDDDANGYIDDTWGWDYCNDDNEPEPGQHGTQVGGNLAGDGTDGTVTGMAPDVEMMVLDITCGTPDSIAWESSDYAIDNGADIITMSYIWPFTEDPDQEAFRRQMDTELAAGVIRANAAGNDGGSSLRPVPYNVSAPASSPPPWLHPDQLLIGDISSTLAVANVEVSSDDLVSSSSRGPNAWEDIQANTDPTYPYVNPPEYEDYPYENNAQMGLLKPDIAAYGNGTTATCTGGGYCTFSGTSAATPNIAGTMALMLQASPEATPRTLAEAIMLTAQHRGDPGKNNDFGTGMVRAYDAVVRVQSDIFFDSYSIDDTAGGNADLGLDPGESVTMKIVVRNITETTAVGGVSAILSTTTPGVEVHNHVGGFPTVPATGSVESLAPHFSFTVDPGTCADAITFDLELRFNGETHLTTFDVGVGAASQVTYFDVDFETDPGWTTDNGTATAGFWVREDPIPSQDFSQRQANPGDDTTPDPGTHCFVTGNGGSLFNVNANDVDGGSVSLTSPTFGSPNLLRLELRYDGWYYGANSIPSDEFRVEVTNDGGQSWTTLETRNIVFGGWYTREFNLLPALSPTADMQLRFSASDFGGDGPVEAAVDEVRIRGVEAVCESWTPPSALAPNPVGNTLLAAADPGGHVVLSWSAPPVDGGHDPATLYRVDHDVSAQGAFSEIGSATATTFADVDALAAPGVSYYLVRAENSGGPE
ncbi:MAG: S8 family serine peptidase [bacterium]|nr:S8 family serine peptidase [bacterium]